MDKKHGTHDDAARFVQAILGQIGRQNLGKVVSCVDVAYSVQARYGQVCLEGWFRALTSRACGVKVGFVR